MNPPPSKCPTCQLKSQAARWDSERTGSLDLWLFTECGHTAIASQTVITTRRTRHTARKQHAQVVSK